MTAFRQARSCIKLLPDPAAQFHLHFRAGQALSEGARTGEPCVLLFPGDIPDLCVPEKGAASIQDPEGKAGPQWGRQHQEGGCCKSAGEEKDVAPTAAGMI